MMDRPQTSTALLIQSFSYENKASCLRRLSDQRSIVRENLIEAIPVQTILKRKALRDRINLLYRLALKVFCPLAHEELGDEDVPRQPADAICQLPHRRRVQVLVFGLDLLFDQVDERLVDVSHRAVVCAPRVDGESVLLGEEVFEERHVCCLLRDVHHALEADVLVQPDRPAQTVLDRNITSEEFDGVNPVKRTLL